MFQIGWKTVQWKTEPEFTLMKEVLKHLPMSVCANDLDDDRLALSVNQVCARESPSGKDTCQNDM